MQFLFNARQLLFFQCGSICRLMLSKPEKPGLVDGTIVYFRVLDLETAYAELTGKSIIFLESPRLIAKMPEHDLWLGIFKHSEGNFVSLMSEVAHAPE